MTVYRVMLIHLDEDQERWYLAQTSGMSEPEKSEFLNMLIEGDIKPVGEADFFWTWVTDKEIDE